MRKEAKVFSAYETEIKFGEKEKTVIDDDFSDGVIVDNTGFEKQFPVLTFPSGISYVKINGENKLEIDTDETGELTLDFNEQEYKVNGENIISDLNFVDDEIVYLPENEEVTVEVDGSGELEYYIYKDFDREEFINNLTITFDRETVNNRPLDDKDYSFSISKLAYDWNWFDLSQEEEKYRIKYVEDHSTEDKKYTKCLVGVVIEDYNRNFGDGEDILEESLDGLAESILKL